MPESLISKDRLMQEFAGDEEILRDMTVAFRAELPNLMTKIETAIKEKDPKKLEYGAHTLKGAISNFQAPSLTDAAFTLEKMGRAGDIGGASESMAKLQALLVAFDKELAGLLESCAAA